MNCLKTSDTIVIKAGYLNDLLRGSLKQNFKIVRIIKNKFKNITEILFVYKDIYNYNRYFVCSWEM